MKPLPNSGTEFSGLKNDSFTFPFTKTCNWFLPRNSFLQSGKTLDTSLEMPEKSSMGRSFRIPSNSKSRSSLFLCLICRDCAVPPHKYKSLTASICETTSKTGIVSALSPNFQSWFSILFQISVWFLDIEEHDSQKPVDDAVKVTLRDQALPPYILNASHRIYSA